MHKVAIFSIAVPVMTCFVVLMGWGTCEKWGGDEKIRKE
jgi:hypothetical protein